MTTTRHSFTSIAAALAMAAALIAAMGPRVVAEESISRTLTYDIVVEEYCDEVLAGWAPELTADVDFADVTPTSGDSSLNSIQFNWVPEVDEDCNEIDPDGDVVIQLDSVILVEDADGDAVVDQPDESLRPKERLGFGTIMVQNDDGLVEEVDIQIEVPALAVGGLYRVEIEVEWYPSGAPAP